MNERERWIDVVKGFGILLMVIGHTNISDCIKVWIYGFHMPLFFIVAGYLSYGSRIQGGLKSILKRNVKAYLLPYVLFFAFNFITYSIMEVLIGEFKINKLLGYIIAGIYSHDTRMPNCAPLWFLTCLFVSFIPFFILVNLKTKILQYVFMVFQCTLLFLIVKFMEIEGINQLPWHIDVALISSVFMFFGYQIRKNNKKIFENKNNKIIALTCLIIGAFIIFYNGRINMVKNQYQNMLLFLIGALLNTYAFMLISKTLDTIKNNLLNYVLNILSFWGRNTLFFVGLNYFFNIILRVCFKLFKIENTFIYNIIDIFTVMLGCSILIQIYKVLKSKLDSIL